MPKYMVVDVAVDGMRSGGWDWHGLGWCGAMGSGQKPGAETNAPEAGVINGFA